MPDECKYDEFLRSGSNDKPVVRELAARLRKDGLRVWLDERGLKAGDSIPVKIEEGLGHTRVPAAPVVSVRRRWMLRMSTNALALDLGCLEAGTFGCRYPLNKKRRVTPLRLGGPPIKASLAEFLYINWRVAGKPFTKASLRSKEIGGICSKLWGKRGVTLNDIWPTRVQEGR